MLIYKCPNYHEQSVNPGRCYLCNAQLVASGYNTNMERTPDVSRVYPGARAELTVLPPFEDKDVVLAALKKQLSEDVIDLDTYSERRKAYLEKLLPPTEPPDIVA